MRGRAVNLLAASIASAAILYLTFVGAGPLPALGPTFNPSTGAWTIGADAAETGSQTLHLKGLTQPVNVTFEKDGTAHVVAQTDHDLFLAVGYVHARFRLFQMDLLRRQGEGRLSEVVGKTALDSDRLELELGLLRTAQQEWKQLAADRPSHDALVAYAQGVNDRIEEAKREHQLPAMFTLLGYEPQPWTPIDSLIVKGDMTQSLDFNDTAIVMALVAKSLGPDLTAKWFPVLPPNPQSPYDLGPYSPPPPQPAAVETITDAQTMAASSLYKRFSSLPSGLVATGGNSNNWAVAGSKSASGGALLAGDPHLHLTLPAIWFQITEDSPSYHTSGVSIPGTPVVLIGHNEHIAWSLTNGQNQATLYYQEQEDASHPNQYFWQGAWHDYQTVKYDIPVLGGATEHLTVKLSAHGPVMTDRGTTTSVWWAGNLVSQDLDVMLNVAKAADFSSFREALRGWLAPSQNFAYADDQGNIGIISTGYYPQVAKGDPSLPLPGTGESDVTGTIPYSEVPQTYNPPDGIVWSANQRQVGATYPYYIGTASNDFDPGYRANEINRFLKQDKQFSADDMMALQTDTRDFLASEITPVLLDAIGSDKLNVQESSVSLLLARWDYRMEADSPAATVWWTFWQRYLSATFDAYWKAKGVTVERSQLDNALGQDLEAWTLNDQANPAFSIGGTTRTATDVMRIAFHDTVSTLNKQLGSDPKTWTWGRIHTRVIENLAQIKGLDYGPRPDSGDAYTPLAARGFPSVDGPSWRMVVDWGSKSFSGIYPGGQSENPASAWYDDRVNEWFEGRYSPMLTADAAATSPGATTWSLQP